MAVERWPGIESAREARDVAAGAWRAAAVGDVTAFAVGDGGPRSADAVEGPRTAIDGAQTVGTAAGLLLAPEQSATRWSPLDLGQALRLLAQAPPASGTVVVPVGDEAPAGDATDVWGGELPTMRRALAGVSLRVLVTADRPLLGFQGMSAALRLGRESDAAIAVAAQEQEERWRRIAATADAVGSRGTLLGPGRLSEAPGSGAAGGLAYCLAAVGATVTRAIDYLADTAGVGDAVGRGADGGADLVVAVGPRLTPHALDHGIAATAARYAAIHAIPAIALTPEVAVGRRDVMAAGLSGTHEGATGAAGLVDTVSRAAQTWARR